MVALHNKRLTARDIWPDNIWNDQDLERVRDAIDLNVHAQDLTPLQRNFEASRQLMEYIQTHSPGLREQQRVMAIVAKPQAGTPAAVFTDEELRAIQGRFAMANDPTGRSILDKIAVHFERCQT